MDEITRSVAPTGAIPGILTVQVDQLKNFRSDVTVPYVIAELGHQIMQTDIDDPTKNKFYFETDFVEPNAVIFITVMNSNQHKPIGYFTIPFEKIAREVNEAIKFENAPLRAEKLENTVKTAQGNITLSFMFAPHQEDSDIATENGRMKDFNHDGVLKLAVLKGTNLANLENLDKFQHLFLELYHNKAINPKPHITEKKKRKNAQFDDTLYYRINKDSKFLINLINVEKYRFLAGAYEFAVKDYENLVRHKPQTFPLVLTDNYLFKAQLFCEMTFLCNYFTEFPVGKLEIEVLSLQNLGGGSFKFAIEGSEGAECDDPSKFTKSSTIRKFKTGGKLDKISLICLEGNSLNSVMARGQFYLCELRWAKQNEEDAFYEVRKTIELVGKNVTTRVKVALKYTPENSLKPNPALNFHSVVNKNILDGVLKFAILSGTNLTRLDKFQFVSLEIYHNREVNPKPYLTERKKQKNAQFNETFWFQTNSESNFLIHLINADKHRFIAGLCEFTLKDYDNLVRYKPHTFPLVLTDSVVFQAQLFCEMTLFSNYFTEFPVGLLKIEVLSLPKFEEKSKFYFKFAIEGSEGCECEDTSKFVASSTIRRFKTGGKLDKISLLCFEQRIDTLMTTLIARGQFNLCELRWAKQDSEDDIYQVIKTIELVGRDVTLTTNLSLKYRSLESLKQNP